MLVSRTIELVICWKLLAFLANPLLSWAQVVVAPEFGVKEHILYSCPKVIIIVLLLITVKVVALSKGLFKVSEIRDWVGSEFMTS